MMYNNNMRISKELQIGKAGEYLVCADLILKGLIAYPSEQGLPYDICIDNGKKIIRCQVKTTEGLRNISQRKKETKCYIFNIKRHGKNNNQRYGLNEIDIFALVCLDTKKIGYIKNQDMPCTINIRDDRLKGKYYDEIGQYNYKAVHQLKNEKTYISQTKIAEYLNMHVAQVNRMLKKDYIPYKTNARYFNDFDRNLEWFLNL